MSPIHFTNRNSLVGLAAATIATATLFVTSARAGDCCSRQKTGGGRDRGAQAAGHEHAGHQQTAGRRASIVTQPPHGGQVYAGQFQYYEVVYRPQDTRVYVYGTDQRPVSPRGVQGQIVMQVHGDEQLYRYPLKYYTVPGSSPGEDFLAAAVDVSRVRDGDMAVTFHLENLPYRQQPQVSFTQTFALTQARPTVTVVALTESDRAQVAKQRVCPVMGTELGSMGAPVKMLVGDQAVYLCCQGCISKVRENPERYVTNATPVRQQPAQEATGWELTVTKATAADRAAIQAQGACPVMNSQLGSMGVPIKVTRGGQSLFLCCQGCVSKVEKSSDYYFALATRMRTGG